jgi:hypothetical protein
MSRTCALTIAFLIVPLIVGGCIDNLAVSDAQVHLITGWMMFLGRTFPNVRINGAAIVAGLACLAGLAVGGHWFLAWLYKALAREDNSEGEASPPRWRLRWTAYLLGLTVVAFAAGISAVGIVHQASWLATSPDTGLGYRGK